MFTFTLLQRRVFAALMAGIFVYDLFAQAHYLRGPLFTAPEAFAWAPWASLVLAAIGLARSAARRPALLALALLHYGVTYANGQLYTEGDTWLWLMALAFVAIPDEGPVTRSVWVGVLKLIGFSVYFFAGLHKAIRADWWSGQALTNVFFDHTLINPKYLFIGDSPAVCKALCWITLFQRLVVPWGFWSRRLVVRRISAGSLMLMHYSYMLIMNLGTFSWVGVLYLCPYLLEQENENDYYRLPIGARWPSFAAAGFVGAYLVFFPALDLALNLGLPARAATLKEWNPPGILLNWGMFANTTSNQLLPAYSVKTCSGRILADDDVYWDFGSSQDYFRRRALRGVIGTELLDETRRGPLEGRVLRNVRETVAERRVVILNITREVTRPVFDSGAQFVSRCPAAYTGPGDVLPTGAQAPNIIAQNQDGKAIRLLTHTGSFVLLYFYPKDDSPGCTKEACSFRDEFTKLRRLNITVIGVSRQDTASHRGFASKHKLPFDLLVDRDGSIAHAFGVKFRASSGLLERQSVLIGPDGKVIRFYATVDPDTHVQEVIEDVRQALSTATQVPEAAL